MDNYCYITLRCLYCENSNCSIARKYIPQDSKEGCTRKVTEDISDTYEHYIKEVIPFMYIKTSKEYQKRMYKEITDFFISIYKCPIGNKLSSNGKISKKFV